MTRDWSRCHLCGSPEPEADSPRGSPTCAECRPIRDHVVSMRTAPGGGSLAVCQCGWRAEAGGKGHHLITDARVRMHWREVIRRTRDERETVSIAELVAGEVQAAIAGVSAFVFITFGAVGVALLADAVRGAV